MPPIKRKNYQQNLPPNFLQVHRSYIVNMDKVLEIERAISLWIRKPGFL